MTVLRRSTISHRRGSTVLLAMLVLVATGCGGEGDAGATLPGGELVPCESPEGFAISAPADWATNEGGVVAPCGQFNPEPFDVPRATDERVAAITVYIDRVEFADVAQPGDSRNVDRAVTAVDGRQAVRLSYETTGEGLYPPGTRITKYLVDVERDNGEPATLIADTLGTEPFAYETNTVVLDRMVQTLELTDPRVESDPFVVATYLGGGGGFAVRADTVADAICLHIPPDGEPVCTDPPAQDHVHSLTLPDLDRDVPAGVTGGRVWRVDLVTSANETYSYLPVPVPDADAGGYAFADTVGDIERLVLFDVTGEELRTVDL